MLYFFYIKKFFLKKIKTNNKNNIYIYCFKINKIYNIKNIIFINNIYNRFIINFEIIQNKKNYYFYYS